MVFKNHSWGDRKVMELVGQKVWEALPALFFYPYFCASILRNNLKCSISFCPENDVYVCVVRELYQRNCSNTKNRPQTYFSWVFFPLKEGSDKLVRAGLLICACRGSFSLKGAWEIPSDAPFISVATQLACNLRDIVADNRTCPLWTQRTISRAGVKSDFSPLRWIHLCFYSSFLSLSFSLQPYRLSLTIIWQTAPAH